MPGLRADITRTFRKLTGREDSNPDPALVETTLATDPRHGLQYGNYKILRRLGAGGMGHVYLALDTRLGRHAALKFLSPRLKDDPEMLARLQQEARTASSLNHPNILTIYDIAEAAGEPFIASEFVEGTTLRHALERNLVEPAAAVDIALQVTSALIAAHDAGIVHRDLKPANIMLRPDGLVKVIDFGLAKFAAGGYMPPSYEPVTTPGAIAGTVQYMSPEQARGEPLDHRTDIWSLGVILYEMLSRRHPFEGDTESHIIVAILDHPAPPLKTTGGIFERALAKDPAKRYQSAADFQAALQRLEPSTRARLKPAPRRKTLWPLLVPLFAIAVLAFCWQTFNWRERLFGPDWFQPAAYQQVTHRGDVLTAVLSPDARTLAYTTSTHDRDRIHLLDLTTQTAKDLPPFAGSLVGLSFSPDSHSLYYTLHDQREWGRLYSASVESAESKFVLDDIDGPVSFSPDGRKFLFRRRFDDKRTNREAIVLVPTDDTGDQRVIFSKYNTTIGGRLAWSPDGNAIAVVVGKTNLEDAVKPTISLLSPDGKTLREFAYPWRLLSGPIWLNQGTLLGFIGAAKGDAEDQGRLREFFTGDATWRDFPGTPLTINGMSISRDERTLSAVTMNRRASLWVTNAESLDQLTEWPVNSNSIWSFGWGAQGGLLFAAQKSNTLALWNSDQPSASHQISFPDGCMEQQPLLLPGQRFLVFASNCATNGNNQNLWQLDTASGDSKQLTFGANFDQDADVTPDGQTLVFNSWISNAPSVRKLPLNGGSATQLTRFQSRNPVVSPDGKLVACQIRENYDGNWRWALLSLRDGSIQRDQITQIPAFDGAPMRWSPDGQELDYVDPSHANSQIWRFPLSGAAPHLLLDAPGKRIADFRWNRDGTRIALLSVETSSDVVLLHKEKIK
jgi:serine/threonine protein kinase